MTTLKVGAIEHPDDADTPVSLGGTGGLRVPQGTNAQRPSNAQGLLRYNTDVNQFEYNNGSTWYRVKDGPSVNVQYLVIAGGGGGGGKFEAGGGGAGGYRTNFGTGNISGGNSVVENELLLSEGTAYTVTVGAGGTGGNSSNSWLGQRGEDSVLAGITSYGGGGGGAYDGLMPTGQLPVGSGGGYPNDSSTTGNGQAGTDGQGTDGGSKTIATHCSTYSGCGGGGAGEQGDDRTTCLQVCDGGDGLASSITGTSVTRAGGGGGGAYTGGIGTGSGGAGGGGDAGAASAGNQNGVSGTVNTGGGGGGAGGQSGTSLGGGGGSGIVIIRIPNTHQATFSASLTASAASSVGSDRVYEVTAGTGTVTFTVN